MIGAATRAWRAAAALAVGMATAACGPVEDTEGVDVDWQQNAVEHRGKDNQRFTFRCPPDGTFASVWGVDVYTDDSSICTAAVHAGKLSPVSGGNVTIEIRPGLSEYAGSTRNGITTSEYGEWPGSFIFPE